MNNTKRLSRRRMLKESSAALAALGLVATAFGKPFSVHANHQETMDTRLPTPTGPGSVSQAPRLPAGFTKTFKSRFVQANGIRQHVVIGGEGPPLLLVHGWPENWYAWRLLMPALAQDFTVIAVDQRGIGLTDKPAGGYDSATLASDLVALMGALGHQRFAVVGHDTGFIIGYALAADHPERVARVALAEIPGPPLPPPPPPLPGSPPLFLPEPINNKLWHIPFNRVNDELIVDMVSSNADGFYRYEFAIQGGGATPPEHATEYYINLYNRNKNVLRASFGLYRAWDATLAQNNQRKDTLLTMPVLAVGGATSWGAAVGGEMQKLANDVQSVVIPGTGHWVAETAPEAMLTALSAFLAPYRGESAAAAR
jgi:pimeloyl-ACP methyl ester carboxylesterase